MKEVGYTAGVIVHRLAAVVAPTDPAEVAVHRVAVHRAAVRKAAVHMIAGLVVDSMELAAPGQDREIGDTETEAVGLEGAGEACCSQTVLEDRVMMCHKNLGRVVVNRETAVVHLSLGAGAWEGQVVVVVHMGLVLVPGAGAAGRRCSWKPFCLREACVARAREQLVAGRVQRAGDPRGRGGLLGVKSGVGTRHGLQMTSLGGGGYSRAEGDDDAGRAGANSKRKSFDLPRERRQLGHLDTLGTAAVQAAYMR